jgi:hypothetical protein
MQANRIARVFTALFVTAAAALVLASCSSGPKIFVNQDPNANFSTYKTYNYLEPLGTDERKGYRSVLSNYLISAMDREMQSRGYTKAADPNLWVNFHVYKEEKVRATSTPTMGGYYGYRGGYYGAYRGYGGGYDTTVTQYTEGTLNIDIVDNKSDTLVWEGVAVGTITDKVRENLEAAANSVVSEVMVKYPYTAAGFVPSTPSQPAK